MVRVFRSLPGRCASERTSTSFNPDLSCPFKVVSYHLPSSLRLRRSPRTPKLRPQRPALVLIPPLHSIHWLSRESSTPLASRLCRASVPLPTKSPSSKLKPFL